MMFKEGVFKFLQFLLCYLVEFIAYTYFNKCVLNSFIYRGKRHREREDIEPAVRPNYLLTWQTHSFTVLFYFVSCRRFPRIFIIFVFDF